MVQRGVKGMRELIRTLGLILALMLLATESPLAWPWGPKTLVTINGENHTSEDFENWWANWKEKDTPFPDTPEPFIEWHLLAQEAISMELFREPTYQHKVETFLKVRTLLILKNEAVDSKIKIKDLDIKNRYEKEYVPRWRVKALYFNGEEQATQAFEKLTSGGLALSDLEQWPAANGGPSHFEERWLRPKDAPGAWRDVLGRMETGETAAPFEIPNGFAVLHIVEKKGPEPADLESLSQRIRKNIWDIRQAELTDELVRGLQEEYQVKVDRELLAELDPANVPEELLDKPLIMTKRGQVPVRVFVEQVRKEQGMRTRHGFNKQETEALKERILGGIISQTLTSWAALDRHYEEKPPFKWVFRFYCQHRLIRELERRLFEPEAIVSDDEIAAYYQAHLAEFTRPETVNIAVLEDDAKLADKIWGEIIRGEDFFDVASKYYSRAVPVRELPFEHLDPVVKEVVSKLAKGEVSAPFEVSGRSTLVKLIDRKEARPLPLEMVRANISPRFQGEKCAALRADYVAQLKAKSDITVNENVWEAIKRELGVRDDGKSN